MKVQRKYWQVWFVGLTLLAIPLTVGAMQERRSLGEPKVVTVTDKEKDTKVSLAVGDLLIVRLEAPLGEGYLWQITKNNKERLKPLEKPPLDKIGKSPPSKVELQAYYLDAKTAGLVELELEYRKKEDKEAKAIKTYKFNVKITE